ncbi:hypothetical protein VTJ04DRAFT_5941 [Mycothermus thermophilus]|uniref:uncharacterized protein n=1 Tax=Humicola insolens TaxID=85995 RepID=UPI0037430224
MVGSKTARSAWRPPHFAFQALSGNRIPMRVSWIEYGVAFFPALSLRWTEAAIPKPRLSETHTAQSLIADSDEALQPTGRCGGGLGIAVDKTSAPFRTGGSGTWRGHPS